MGNAHLHKVAEPDLHGKAQGVAYCNELVPVGDGNQNKASFLLDHLVFTDPVDAASPQNVGTFHKFVGVCGDLNVTEQLFHGDV